jgi:hypothetical protein
MHVAQHRYTYTANVHAKHIGMRALHIISSFSTQEQVHHKQAVTAIEAEDKSMMCCCELIDEIVVFKLSLSSQISVLANRTHAIAVMRRSASLLHSPPYKPLTLAMRGRVKDYYNNHNLTQFERNHTHKTQASMCASQLSLAFLTHISMLSSVSYTSFVLCSPPL